MTREEIIDDFIKNPDLLLEKEPFTRGADQYVRDVYDTTVGTNGKVKVTLPTTRRRIVTQEQFMRELDPACHDCLFDLNIPSICVKVSDNDYREVKYERVAMPFQRIILNKQVQHLTGNPMEFTLMETDPTDEQMRQYQVLKQYWKRRNQDGMKRRFVEKQMSLGDAGLLYYMDYKGEIKSRLLSFDKGYVLCPHNDDNGDRVAEAVYYHSKGRDYIDMYTDRMLYRFVNGVDDTTGETTGWTVAKGYPKEHGFSEIPLVTKRGDVVWNDAQSIIESWEVLNNVFNAIQKRFGWGLLYIKGTFASKAQKIAGNVVLNDTSLDGKGDAKFLTPPSPEGTIQTLEKLEKCIKLAGGATFILPEDVKLSGEIAGISIQLTQSLDIEKAEQNAIEYQNVADKMLRLFKEGLSKELVRKGIDKAAFTEYGKLNVGASFRIWTPYSKSEYNQMLIQLKGAGLISTKTGVEKNTESAPDEHARLASEPKETEGTGTTETIVE